MIVRRALAFSLLLLLANVPAAPAALFDDLARDFAPQSGYVVMAADGEFLIDRDAAAGIRVGDLFAVVRPGEKIVHPVTGAVLGTLDRVKGFLEVTRIKPGYSHTRPIDVKEEIGPGDVIRRFEHLPAVFLDATGRGVPIYERLRTVLPGLKWQKAAAPAGEAKPSVPEGAALTFVLAHDRLEVRGPAGTLRTYEIGGPEPGTAPVPSAGPGTPSPGGQGALVAKREPAGKPAAADFVVRGALPEAALMADFVRDGDRLLLAVTEGSRIEVFAVGDNLAPVAAGDTARPGRFHSVHWWQPQTGGPPLLAATMAVEENRAFGPSIGQTILGAVFALRQGRLVPIREDIPFLLGSFDRDGDGVRETLLGQSFDLDTFFGDRVREIRLKGGNIEIAEPSVAVSRPFAVQGALFTDLTGDGRPETVFVRNRTLFVYDGRELLYESSEQMGGSLSTMTYDVNPGAVNRLFTTAAFEVPPAAVDLDGDGRMELVAIASEGSGVTGMGSGVRKSWLATVNYRDGRFVRGSLGPELETPLQGLHVSRNGVFVVAAHPPSLFNPKKASYLLFLPLGR